MSTAPDNRTALAVALLGSALVMVIAVQAPALVSPLELGTVWLALYAFLRL
ncbi:hypothetical protein ACUXZZ_44660 [Streptomyces graminifolii]|uniref:hypothetical protein n=1 Tax=Streptomyces graminifolii TaxID=1266771 RepID=UPI00405863FC